MGTGVHCRGHDSMPLGTYPTTIKHAENQHEHAAISATCCRFQPGPRAARCRGRFRRGASSVRSVGAGLDPANDLLLGLRRQLHAGVGGRRFTIVATDVGKPIRHGVARHPQQRPNGLLRPPLRVGLAETASDLLLGSSRSAWRRRSRPGQRRTKCESLPDLFVRNLTNKPSTRRRKSPKPPASHTTPSPRSRRSPPP